MPSKRRRGGGSEHSLAASIPVEGNSTMDEAGVMPLGKAPFFFVNVNPSVENENTLDRFLIRSHAGKHIWRQHRAALRSGTTIRPFGRDISSRSTTSVTSSERSPQKEDEDAFTPEFPEDRIEFLDLDDRMVLTDSSEETQPEELSIPTWDDETQFSELASSKRQNSLCSWQSQRPMSLLENGIADPFHTYPSTLGESFISKLMRYSVTELWPTLLPGANSNNGGAAVQWLNPAMNHPALFDAFMYGAATHMQTRKRLGSAQIELQSQQEKLELIITEAETIRHLNRLLQDPVQACSDELILAVLCMAFNRVDDSAWSAADPPLRPPLRNLQWLNVYGTLSGNHVHVEGLLELIELRGGQERMKMPGLAETVSFASILLASKLLTKPRLSFTPLLKKKVPNMSSSMSPHSMSESHGGFDKFGDAGLTHELVDVLRGMCEYNSTIELYSQGMIPYPNMAAIADKRNWVQHCLLSLPSVHDFDGQYFQGHRTYEPCRVAAIMYSLLIIFPLPAATAPFPRLAGMLKAALIDSELRTSWDSALELLTWILVVGGIASKNAPERIWFVAALGRLTATVRISKWEELKRVVKSFLWVESACDSAGQALWNEILDLGP